MNANARGTPPKLARTPEAVSTALRRAWEREVTTAWAMRTPRTEAMSAVTAESCTLPTSDPR